MTKLSHTLLMRYFDGELSEAEARAVEAQMAADPEAEQVLAELAALGDVLREGGVRGEIGHVDLADSVMQSLEVETQPAIREPASKNGSRAHGERHWLRRTSAVFAVSVAMAAGAALALRLNRMPVQAPAPSAAHLQLPAASIAVAVNETSAADAASDDDTSTPASIESVDFGSRAGTIFLVPDGEETTPVVWLVDEPGPSLGRMEPL